MGSISNLMLFVGLDLGMSSFIVEGRDDLHISLIWALVAWRQKYQSFVFITTNVVAFIMCVGCKCDGSRGLVLKLSCNLLVYHVAFYSLYFGFP
jgi:hypothetical protein